MGENSTGVKWVNQRYFQVSAPRQQLWKFYLKFVSMIQHNFLSMESHSFQPGLPSIIIGYEMSLVCLIANDCYGPGEGTTQSVMSLISCIPESQKWERQCFCNFFSGKFLMFTISIVSMNDGYVISISFKEKYYYLETAECKKERKTLLPLHSKCHLILKATCHQGKKCVCVCIFLILGDFHGAPNLFSSLQGAYHMVFQENNPELIFQFSSEGQNLQHH